MIFFQIKSINPNSERISHVLGTINVEIVKIPRGVPLCSVPGNCRLPSLEAESGATDTHSLCSRRHRVLKQWVPGATGNPNCKYPVQRRTKTVSTQCNLVLKLSVPSATGNTNCKYPVPPGTQVTILETLNESYLGLCCPCPTKFHRGKGSYQ